MDKLWAPWRMNYIRNSKKEKGCLFCRILKSKKDKNDLVVFRSKYATAMLNLYPYNNGHIMVSPKRHVASLELLNTQETIDLMGALNKAKRLLDKTLKPQGYNIGINIGRAAGAGIEGHLHIHIVPRWNGDTNFMPALFSTKIISQSLKELHRQLTINNK